MAVVDGKKLSALDQVLQQNFLLHVEKKPIAVLEQERKPESKDLLFYIIAAIMLFLGILRASFTRYFSNLVRVFLNTSLRQSQLTDQLLQSKLPSLFFNLFFGLISGMYIFLLLNYFGKTAYRDWNILLFCILAILMIYLVKNAVLHFTGWLTGFRQEAGTYIFIVFLINKIIALILVPIVILMAFSSPRVVQITIIISYFLIGVMLLLRFLRSYSLLQQKMKVSSFHFILYITGIELLPILLIYKAALVILSKSL